MKIKFFLTLAMIVNLTYGSLYFLAPQYSAEMYGFDNLATPLSEMILQFLGIMFLAEGVMCGIARKAEASTGRMAVLSFIAVSAGLCFYLDIKILMDAPGSMDYIDSFVNGLFAFTAIYFILQDRKRAVKA